MRPTWLATGQGLATATTPSAAPATASTGKTSSGSHSIPRPPAECTTKRCHKKPSRPRPSAACAAPSSARCGSARTSASMPRQPPPWYSSSQSGRQTDRPSGGPFSGRDARDRGQTPPVLLKPPFIACPDIILQLGGDALSPRCSLGIVVAKKTYI